MSKIVIAAGGTGGHVFPGLAVAKALEKKQIKVIWFGTKSGLEHRVIPENGIIFYKFNIKGLRGKSKLIKLCNSIRLAWASLRSICLILWLRPRAVLIMGGYIGAAVGLAAKLMRIPILLHEQNAIAGMTNKVLARFASQVMSGFAHAFPSGVNFTLTGNPLREGIIAAAGKKSAYVLEQNTPRPLRVLVFGGSQGAVNLNLYLLAAFKELSSAQQPEIWHQTGEVSYASVSSAYANYDKPVQVNAFIDDMAQAYAWADCVIARAGALSVAEISAIKLPALFIPLPYAVDNHQYYNAMSLVDAGVARVILEKDAADVDKLLSELVCFFAKENLIQMLGAYENIKYTDATQAVCNECLVYVENN